MNLNDAQKQQVSAWIAEGLKVSEIQIRMEKELGIKMTYMEVRFLLDDLKVVPKDPVPPPTPPELPKAVAPPAPATSTAAAPPPPAAEPLTEALPPGASGVKVTVDQIARPGAMISGSVTFSDGQSGTWYLDQMGRLGLGMKNKGYRPSAADVEDFQMQLQQELAKLGY